MKKTVKRAAIGLAASSICALAIVGTYQSSVHEPSDVILQNVEALTQNEYGSGSGTGTGTGTGVGTLWIREDGDCVYEVSGSAKGEVSITLVGIGVVKVKLGADGKGSYTYGGGKTNCKAGGDEQCTARYCPALL